MERGDLSAERLRVPVSQWLSVLQSEYLDGFLPAGGSAVKVVSGTASQLAEVRAALAKTDQSGYLSVALDPGKAMPGGKKPDLHRIEKFFFAATSSVDWKGLAMAQAYAYLEQKGLDIEGHTLDDLDGIARANGRDAGDLLNEYQRELATPQIRDFGMALEFRTAITALGRAQLVRDFVSPTLEEVLLGWFAGTTMPGAATALKKIQIYDRINQANARQVLLSFCRWLPKTGRTGLVVTLDLRPYEHKKQTPAQRNSEHLRRLRAAIDAGLTGDALAEVARGPEAEPEVTYSDAAYMQMLTMIRHFIDEIDWFEHFLLVVLTSPSFYDPVSRRNYNNYDALQTRIGLEVHDARRANPAAALVHLGGDE
jgi:hypothetical protein